ALIFGKEVFTYAPQGSWGSSLTGIMVVGVEGGATSQTLVPTKSVVNSCASNSQTGITVCTANSNEIYILKEKEIINTLTSEGAGAISFTGGSCTNCGVAMDSVHNRALIALSLEGRAGF